MWRLTVHDCSGTEQGVVEVSSYETAAWLKDWISNLEGTPLEQVQLVSPRGEQVRGELPLFAFHLRDGDCLTLVRLPVPEGSDMVGECDGCDDVRHLFYEYARRYPGADAEPVLALCSACGGRPQRPQDSGGSSVDGFSSDGEDVL